MGGSRSARKKTPRVQAGDHLTLPHTATVDHGERTRVAGVISECSVHCATWTPLVEVKIIDNKCIMEDSGLYLKDVSCIVRRDEKVQMIFINQTSKNYKITRGYIVGHVTALKHMNYLEIQTA